MAREKISRPRVFVTRQIDAGALARLRRAAQVEVWTGELPPSARELRRRLMHADGVLTMLTDRIDADAIASAPRLRVISNFAVGVDNIDLDAATRASIAVGHTPGVLTEATADLAFALLLAAARRVAEGDRMARAGRWRTWGPRVLLGADVFGATLGIIGFGAIGQAMARRAAGFNMRVLYADRSRGKTARRARATGTGARRVTLARLLADSDFVSLHVPLTPRTHHLLGRRGFLRMKRGAILINTARGQVVDQKALCAALESGHLGGAGLDVTDPEPPPRGDPLLRLDNVVLTPHIGSASRATRDQMGAMAVENILAALAGRRPRWCANPEVKLRN
jgi:glyoxylate reductase